MKLQYFSRKFSESIFRSCDEAQLTKVLKRAKKLRFRVKDLIFREKEQVNGIFLIAKGTVQLVKHLPMVYLSDSKSQQQCESETFLLSPNKQPPQQQQAELNAPHQLSVPIPILINE